MTYRRPKFPTTVNLRGAKIWKAFKYWLDYQVPRGSFIINNLCSRLELKAGIRCLDVIDKFPAFHHWRTNLRGELAVFKIPRFTFSLSFSLSLSLFPWCQKYNKCRAQDGVYHNIPRALSHLAASRQHFYDYLQKPLIHVKVSHRKQRRRFSWSRNTWLTRQEE